MSGADGEPPPVLAYGRRQSGTSGPGSQDVPGFSVGCLSSIVLAIVLVVIRGVRVGDGLTLFGEGSTPRYYLTAFVGLSAVGVLVGRGRRRWGFLIAVFWSAMLLAVLAGVLRAKNFLH